MPGAAVTVFDNSPRQLGRDREVAAREELAVRTVLGDMRDLSVFPDASFDVVFNPVSNVFCPDLAPVWRESLRVLRPGGILMSGFMNPDIFIFDITALDERGELAVRHRLPFTTLDLPDAERQRAYGTGPIEYSHSLTEQIGGPGLTWRHGLTDVMGMWPTEPWHSRRAVIFGAHRSSHCDRADAGWAHGQAANLAC
jgi:SAM-dependent methyltransferase